MGNHYSKTFRLSGPIILSLLGQVFVSIADNVMVGQYGTTDLAACSFANSIFINGLVFGMGFAVALTPLCGQAYGEKDYLKIASILKKGFLSNSLVGVVLTFLLLAFSFFMPLLGQPEGVVKLAVPYFLILVVTVLPTLIFLTFKQVAEGVAQTKPGMWVTLLGNILNIVLNYILIFGKMGFPAMGLMGAGYATLISRIFMMVGMALLFFKGSTFRFFMRFLDKVTFKGPEIKTIGRIGFPIGVQSMAEVAAFSVGTVMMGWFGEIALAAHQIALNVSYLTFMIASGFANASTIRVANFYGQKQGRELRKAAFSSLHIVIGFTLITALLLVVLRDYFPILYTDNAEVVQMAASLMFVAAFYQLFDGIQVVALGALRGIADVKIPLYLAIFAYTVVSLPVGYFTAFVLNMGPQGIWVGYLVGLLTSSILFLNRFNKQSGKLIKKEVHRHKEYSRVEAI